LVKACIEKAQTQIVTLALRRANEGGLANILDYIPDNITLLPNTSGARNAKEAVRIAHLAREMGCGDFVKLEVVHDSKYLLSDNYETIKATEILAKEGFVVMPYMYPDLNAARELADVGAACVMPLGAPIGSNKGLATKDFIQILIDEIDLPIINNDRINPMDVHETQLLQVVCAYRLFMPYASITVSTRECARVRDNLVQIAATKISAGVSTGIGSHAKDIEDKGDDQFEISDGRSVDEIYNDLQRIGMQPVMSDYIYG